jgi:phosphomevalonate kinase
MLQAQRWRQTQASAPGKAVLLGEYVVLEGAPALVAAINRRAHISITDAAIWSLTAPALGVADAEFACLPDGRALFSDARVQALPHLDTVRAVLLVVQELLVRNGYALRPGHVSIDTSAFLAHDGTKLGLGSSAAVSVALVTAFLAHHDAVDTVLPTEPMAQRRAIVMLAADVHARAQGGMGSGVDIAASVYGGVLRFKRCASHMDVVPCTRMPALTTAFTWAGHATSTPEFLARVRAFKDRDRASYGALMDKLSTAARAGADAWDKGHISDFFAAVATSFVGLHELGQCSGADIASAPHRAMDQVVRSLGGVYKSSGAGGGDLGLAFTANQPIAQAVAQALEAADFSMLPLAFDPCGVQFNVCTSMTQESP